MRDGLFVAPALQPGTYFFVYREGPWPPPRGTEAVISQATVVVGANGDDVDRVAVRPVKMVRVSGRLVVADADLPTLHGSSLLRRSTDNRPLYDRSLIVVAANLVPIDGNPGPTFPGEIKSDLSVEFRAWPGPNRIRVTLPSPEWTVKRVRLNGADITDQLVTLVQDRPESGLEIEIGRLKGAREQPTLLALSERVD